MVVKVLIVVSWVRHVDLWLDIVSELQFIMVL
jgi:hypothetical protein